MFASTRATMIEPDADSVRVLVVDDEPTIVMLLRKFLEKQGYAVDSASSVAEAWERLSAAPIDLVITDLAMPQETGFDLLRRIRENRLEPEVIVLTAIGTVDRAVEAMRAGAFDFLEKPVRFEKLREAIDRALARKRATAGTVGSADILAERPIGAAPAAATPPPHPDPEAPPLPPSLPPAAADGAPPAAFGRYVVEALLGRGGMGEVFRCRDSLLGRRVAVKVLQAGVGRPDQYWELIARFQREAVAAGALNHPGIVAVYDLGRDERRGTMFIVQELVDGRGLDRVLEDSGGRLAPKEATAIAFQVCEALAHAHAHDVVHRDVKPSNVLLRRDGSIKLLDFGLAGVPGSALTRGDRLFGSPTYMAPERVRGERGTQAADQFSLGVVFYEALVGANPFDAENMQAQLKRVLELVPIPIVRLLQGVPPELSDLVDRMLAKDPARRYPSTEALLGELRRAGHLLGLHLRRQTGPD
jgi:CheY-like chemotaxis protein